MTNSEVKDKLESSFSPYKCIVQFNKQNYSLDFGLQIYDSKGHVIASLKSIKTSMVNSRDCLDDIITQLKIEIRTSGYPIS